MQRRRNKTTFSHSLSLSLLGAFVERPCAVSLSLSQKRGSSGNGLVFGVHVPLN